MIRTLIFLTVALNLIMSAVAQAATPITALPITISSPGTYVLTGNLTSPLLANDQSAILVTSTAGTVVVDLKGYTLSIVPLSDSGPNITGITVQSSNVTIRNGTIQNFNTAGINVSPPFSGLSYSGYVSNVLVENVTFSNVNGTHVDFIRVNSSEITQCTFLGFAQLAIEDNGSQTGNRFSENSFDGNQRATLEVLFPAGPMVLKHCKFEVPAVN